MKQSHTPSIHSLDLDDGPPDMHPPTTLNMTAVKDGPVQNGQARPHKRPAASLCANNRLFQIFVFLLLFTILLIILILVALLYADNQRTAKKQFSPAFAAMPGLPQSRIASTPDDNTVQAPKNEEEYKKQLEQLNKQEPWRLQPAKAWKDLGGRITENVDPTADACDDFYKYSCGQYISRHPLKNNQQLISERERIRSTVKDTVLQTFAKMTSGDQWPKSVLSAKTFYDKCIAAAANEDQVMQNRKDALTRLQNMFMQSNSGHNVYELHPVERVPGPTDTHAGDQKTRNGSANATSAEIYQKAHENAAEDQGDTNDGHQTTPEHTHQKRNAEEHANVTVILTENTTPETTLATTEQSAPDQHDLDRLKYSNSSNTSSVHISHVTENLTETTTVAAAVLNVTVVIPVNGTATTVNGEQLENTTYVELSTPEPSNETTTLQYHTTTAEVPPDHSQGGEVVPVTTDNTTQVYRVEDIWSLAGQLLSASGVSTFFGIAYISNASQQTVVLRPPELSLKNRRMYLEPLLSSQSLPDLKAAMLDMKQAMQETAPSQNMFTVDDRQVDAIVQLEKSLAQASPMHRSDHCPEVATSKQYSISKLEERWPKVKWNEFLNGLGIQPSSSSSSVFAVENPSYVDQLVGVFEENDVQTLVNYLKWRYLHSVQDFLTYKKWHNLNCTCYNHVEDNLPLVLAHITQKTHYGLSDDEMANLKLDPEPLNHIFNNVKGSLKSVIDFNPRMQNATKGRLNERLSQFQLMQEWPEAVQSADPLDNTYGDLLNFTDHQSILDMLGRVRAPKKLDEQRATWSAAIPQAFTDAVLVEGQKVALVAAPQYLYPQVMQPPISHYATLGWYMARALVKGLLHDGNAPLNDDQFRQCLIDQYNRICYQTPINHCLDGRWSGDENFADNLALEVAYKAYKTWMSTSSSDVSNYLLSSNMDKYTVDQIFFLAYGSDFCENSNEDHVKSTLLEGRETPSDSRLRGTLQNENEFHSAFHCKTGEKMFKDSKTRCQFA